MLVRIGVAGVLRVGAGLGEFFVALVCEREDVLDLMGLARHFVEDEFQLRGESQSGLGAYQGTQASFGLVQGLLRAAAFALLVSFVAELGPVDFRDLQIVGDAHFGDGHVGQSLVVQLRLHGRCDHTLNQRRDARGAGIGSCHCCPFGEKFLLYHGTPAVVNRLWAFLTWLSIRSSKHSATYARFPAFRRSR